MKRLFIIFSVILTAAFLLFAIVNQSHQIKFSSYPAVDIIGTVTGKTAANRERVTESLNTLAEKTGSVIARRVTEPNKEGQTYYTYAVYGAGNLPAGLTEASADSAAASDLVSSYLIISGGLEGQELAAAFEDLGYSAVPVASYSLPMLLLTITLTDISLLSLAIFCLTFSALTVIYRVKDLRSAGYRLISGERRVTILCRALREDGKFISLAIILSVLLGLFVLLAKGLLEILPFFLFLTGLLSYGGLLLFLSFLLSLVYLLGLRKSSLAEVLKGRLPLRSLLSLMLLGQLFSILAVGWLVSGFGYQYQDWQAKEKALKDWQQGKDYMELASSYSSVMGDEAETARQNQAWHSFTQDAVENHAAVVAISNVGRYQGVDSLDGIRLKDYHPAGNTLFVSPSYLDSQQIKADADFLESMQHLKEGEFGLLLPEKLAKDQKTYEDLYRNFMSGFASRDLNPQSPHLFKVRAITATVPDGATRFLYNSGAIAEDQYLYDPIIVVTTPAAMGDTPASHLFWGNSVDDGLKLPGYDPTIQLLRKHGTYNWVSYVLSARLSFLNRLNESRVRFISLLAGTILGVLTSVLLFNAMNLLYFEQFRREIFIKRLSGMTFAEVHFKYLSAQIATLLAGLTVFLFVTGQLSVALLTAALFLGNAALTLYRQHRSESRLAVTVLKGK